MAESDVGTWVIICWMPLFLAVLFGLAWANTRLHWTRMRQAGVAALAILVMIGALFFVLRVFGPM